MKQFFLLVILLFFNSSHAQGIICTYELKHRPIVEKDSIITKNYFLEINGKQSVFRSDFERKADSFKMIKGLDVGRPPLFITELSSRKNLEKHKIDKIIMTPALRNRYFIEINENFIWKIGDQKRKIGDLNCQNAEVDYGGRSWEAWFCPDISMQEGPYVFSGLPGLIVKISDKNLDYDFSLIQLNRRKVSDSFIPEKGKQISWENFKEMFQNYFNDPFYEIKSMGLKYVIGDSEGNVLNINPRKIIERHKANLKKSASNPLELKMML